VSEARLYIGPGAYVRDLRGNPQEVHMGNYHISIEGQGSHHNPDNPGDANRLAAEFVAELRRHGHTVTRATFTHGGAEALGGESEYDVRHRPEPVHPHHSAEPEEG
jgi:hypothetical protein